MKRIWIGAAALALALGAGSQALAWGNNGHKVVALIARHYVTDKTALATMDQLLAKGTTPPLADNKFETNATWADVFKNASPANHTRTGPWHFVDIEIDKPNPTAAQYCKINNPTPPNARASDGDAKDCSVGKINQFIKELSDKNTSPDERELALLYLLHLVGDLHQPLHSSDHHDNGGNGIPVVIQAEDGSYPQNGEPLHTYWDDNTVMSLGSSPGAVASKLIADIGKTPPKAWVGSDATRWASDWANEAFPIGRDTAYGALSQQTQTCLIKQGKAKPKQAQCRVIDATYAAKASDAAKLQLERAGVRLAALLTAALKNG